MHKTKDMEELELKVETKLEDTKRNGYFRCRVAKLGKCGSSLLE